MKQKRPLFPEKSGKIFLQIHLNQILGLFSRKFFLSIENLWRTRVFPYAGRGYSDPEGHPGRRGGWLATSFANRPPDSSGSLDLAREIVPPGFGSVIFFGYIFHK